MKKQTYISPTVTICHYATATMLAGSIDTPIVDGEYEGEFQSKPHNIDLWADDDKEEKKSNLYW